VNLRWFVALVVPLGLLVSCGQAPVADDSGAADSSVDLPGLDASVADAGDDAGLGSDGGSSDAGVADGGFVDGGASDAGVPDAGASDAGVPDAGVPDAGVPDGGAHDAGRQDAGFDAGVIRLPDGGACPSGSGVGVPFRLRAMASNLTSGNFQSYDPGHGQRMLQAMAPDIAMMQEFNFGSNSSADLTSFVDATFDGGVDAGFAWYRGIGGQIPNAVVSRWPILASGDWVDPKVSNRAFTWARVDLPGPRDLWVVSVHLLTSSASERSIEARAIIARLATDVPPTDLLLLGGDFNTDTRIEPALTDFSARTVTEAPWPVDQAGLGGTSGNRNKPYDWVLASPCLHGLQVPVVVGAHTFPSGLVFDTRVYRPLSEVPPVDGSESASSNMQHMGVVRDFIIQP
jgi:endonuclease/exonuclease/phosphatase family metal-dependent hydrolase